MLAITVDIEDWYHIPSVTGSPFSKFRDVDEFFKKWNQRYDYLTEPTMRVGEGKLGLLSNRGFTLEKYEANACEVSE